MSRQQFRNARMSLFVGNISRLVEQKDIEREFKVYGDCTVDFRVKNNDRYAFIQYKSEQEAEAAKNALHQRDLQGLRINVEWSKKSGRYDENREPRRDRPRDDRGQSRGNYDRFEREREKEKKQRRRNSKSRSRSRSPKNRSSPQYRVSRSQSIDSENEPPRDKILRKKLKEMMRKTDNGEYKD
ncbi:unnamed protein product [Paramecium primaurelia]|uniref:RRM domain-containing protein n=2 Tax=Paramecium TaxID=5884 RepID=A0A8S1JN04_PARPR|nr:unnamed protein product [Paramecium primaurelia]CAD8049815.1 unnamed protein product [Paramecium primaurelia]CAD8136775.1 unnamed protein product [Paramecium pentaurelia]